MHSAEATIITPEGTPSSLRVVAIRNASRTQRELEVIGLIRDIVSFSLAGNSVHTDAYVEVLKKCEPLRWAELLAYESINRGDSATLRNVVAAAAGEPWLEQALAACLQRGTISDSDAEFVAAAIVAPSRRLQNYLRRCEHPGAAALRAILRI